VLEPRKSQRIGEQRPIRVVDRVTLELAPAGAS
jgi:hypothetical protein